MQKYVNADGNYFEENRELILFDMVRVFRQLYDYITGLWVACWLEHRTPDLKAWVRCPMPPITLRVHSEYVLVKSGDPKVLWAESRVQGTGECFPPF
ncbi:hypothetical protein TNCV_3507331 [Trichonephila clavipes]|uniref:Uncharacterized protein n=1 Tax=Trichonephila clavipes TaxID=2585209 RepID=A0A8X6S9C1_TRICX|nr:hypothetical protein TNCV_3507331 [Trichonephila clavipes]